MASSFFENPRCAPWAVPGPGHPGHVPGLPAEWCLDAQHKLHGQATWKSPYMIILLLCASKLYVQYMTMCVT